KPKKFSTGNCRRKESEVSTIFFYFSSLCALNPQAHLLYILCDGQADFVRTNRRRFDSASQRPSYFLLGSLGRRSAFSRLHLLSHQSSFPSCVRSLSWRILRYIGWRRNFPCPSLGAHCGSSNCSAGPCFLRFWNPGSHPVASWAFRTRSWSRNP